MSANREKAKIPFYWKKKTVWHELFDGHYIICKFLSFARRNTRAGLGVLIASDLLAWHWLFFLALRSLKTFQVAGKNTSRLQRDK
jgi:hypothetical protein